MTLLSAQLMIDVGHQAAFGALPAWGFGVLFNFDRRSLVWCAALGALALALRTFALAGCIPMAPGAFFGKAILGLFALTAPAPAHTEETAIFAIVAMTRVILTLGAIGAGLAIPTQMSRHRGF